MAKKDRQKKKVSPFVARIGQRIRDLRIERGLSQRELADRAKLWQDFISQIETGGKGPSLDTLNAIAKALGTTAADILSDR